MIFTWKFVLFPINAAFSFLEGWIILQIATNDLRRLPLKTLKTISLHLNSFTKMHLWFLHNKVIRSLEQLVSWQLCQYTLARSRAIRRWECYISAKDINYTLHVPARLPKPFPLWKYVAIELSNSPFTTDWVKLLFVPSIRIIWVDQYTKNFSRTHPKNI